MALLTTKKEQPVRSRDQSALNVTNIRVEDWLRSQGVRSAEITIQEAGQALWRLGPSTWREIRITLMDPLSSLAKGIYETLFNTFCVLWPNQSLSADLAEPDR